MYKSIIDIIHTDMEIKMEGEIMKAVKRCNIEVDKEELLKALQYDRGQYDKGYQDGLNADKWIPFEQREADEEEKEYWLENYGQEIEYMLCGRLPDEDEEIIVSYANGCVSEDIFLCDGVDCYLDSGNELITEAIAWQPLPEPYKKEGAE